MPPFGEDRLIKRKMAAYDAVCKECGHRTKLSPQQMHHRAPCPICGGEMEIEERRVAMKVAEEFSDMSVLEQIAKTLENVGMQNVTKTDTSIEWDDVGSHYVFTAEGNAGKITRDDGAAELSVDVSFPGFLRAYEILKGRPKTGSRYLCMKCGYESTHKQASLTLWCPRCSDKLVSVAKNTEDLVEGDWISWEREGVRGAGYIKSVLPDDRFVVEDEETKQSLTVEETELKTW